MKTGKLLRILMVEDNPGDVRLTSEALKTGKVKVQLHTVPNGEEALNFLRQRNGYAGVPRPDLILLDLNLPKKSGREVIEEIKNDPDLKRIPVVVLTSSQNETDIRLSYSSHANCYVNKPADLEDFLSVIESVVEFWMNVATLPREA